MSSSWWATEITAALSQGDIITGITFSVAVNPLTTLTKGSAKSGMIWVPGTEWVPDANGRGHILMGGRRGAGLILSHSCELDKVKSKGRVIVCPVPALTDLPEEHRSQVLAQRKRSAIPLPDVPGLGTCFGDLNNSQSFDRRVIDTFPRHSSMTPFAQRRLRLQLITFYTRADAELLRIPGDDEAVDDDDRTAQ